VSAIARAHGGWASAANQPSGGAVAALQLLGTVYQPAPTAPRTDNPGCSARTALFGLMVPDCGTVQWRGRPVDARCEPRLTHALIASKRGTYYFICRIGSVAVCRHVSLLGGI
jgi:hypothetical protein